MSYRGGGGDELERYLDALRDELRGLPTELVADLVAEVRCHVRDTLGGASGAGSPGALRAVLDRLGAPADLAAQYRDSTTMAAATRPSLDATGLGRSLRSPLSAAGVLPLLVACALGLCLLVAALHKPFATERVGLWRLGGDEISLHLGFGASPADGDELLGWWIVPLGLVAGAGSGWLALRVGRSLLRGKSELVGRGRPDRGAVLWQRT